MSDVEHQPSSRVAGRYTVMRMAAITLVGGYAVLLSFTGRVDAFGVAVALAIALEVALVDVLLWRSDTSPEFWDARAARGLRRWIYALGVVAFLALAIRLFS